MTPKRTEEDRDILKRVAKQKYAASANGSHDLLDEMAEGTAILVRFDTVEPKDVSWMWQDRLARGKITLLEGDPGLGKSTITIEIAARFSRGQPLPGEGPGKVIRTVFLGNEDGLADTMVPRFIAAGGDREQVHIIKGIYRPGGDPWTTIPEDVPRIMNAMQRADAEFLVIDPLSAYWGDTINENKNQDVRRALTPLKDAIEDADVSTCCIRHWTKAQSASPIYRGQGSIGLAGQARIVLMAAEDPDDPTQMILTGGKNNLGFDAESLAYEILPHPANTKVGTINWKGTSQWSKHDLQGSLNQEDRSRLDEAKDWLVDYLSHEAGATASQLYRDADKDGHAKRTIQRAGDNLGIKPIKDGKTGPWVWKLPPRMPR